MADEPAPIADFPADASMGMISDFSPVAALYDTTRNVPESCLQACYERLVKRGLFPSQGVVLDAGCGTGQVSLPLAAAGYEIHGIDISMEMTLLAQAKVQPGWRASYRVGDVREIPNDDAVFDAVVVSKLFQHVRDWRGACRELVRVTRPGGCVVQINERGAFGNAVRREFSRRADERGFTGRFLGVNPHADDELISYMTRLGCDAVPVDMPDLGWEVRITHGEAIRQIQQRLFAEFWYLPSDVYDGLAAEVIAWVDSRPGGRQTVECLRPRLVVHAFKTPPSTKI